MINKTVSSNFRIFSAVKNVNIGDVHKSTGISRTTLSSLKHGQMEGIKFATLEKLSEYFKVEVYEFFIKGDSDE